jgi:hypothetical protein
MKELRTIIFDEEETARAVIGFCRRSHRPVPAGTLRRFIVFEEGEQAVGVLTIRDDHGTDIDLAFNQEEVAAALVQHCLDRRIPLPRRATKLITSVDGQVVLALEISHRAEIKPYVRAGTRHT